MVIAQATSKHEQCNYQKTADDPITSALHQHHHYYRQIINIGIPYYQVQEYLTAKP